MKMPLHSRSQCMRLAHGKCCIPALGAKKHAVWCELGGQSHGVLRKGREMSSRRYTFSLILWIIYAVNVYAVLIEFARYWGHALNTADKSLDFESLELVPCGRLRNRDYSVEQGGWAGDSRLRLAHGMRFSLERKTLLNQLSSVGIPKSCREDKGSKIWSSASKS